MGCIKARSCLFRYWLVGVSASRNSQAKNNVANRAAISWAAMKAGMSEGVIPAKLSENPLAMVTAGFAKDVEEVNQ